jgi:hypothetical protein
MYSLNYKILNAAPPNSSHKYILKSYPSNTIHKTALYHIIPCQRPGRLKRLCSYRDGVLLGPEKDTCRQDSLTKWID